MKTILTAAGCLLALSSIQYSQAQSTTGGKSGGSTASTGTGYLTEGKRTVTSSPNSMTIDDEGASRAYMYVPPTASKNRAASPNGSGATQPTQPKQTTPGSGTATKKRTGN